MISVIGLWAWAHRRPDDFRWIAAQEGWQFQAASEQHGLFTTLLRDARLSWRYQPGTAVEVEAGRVEIRHWPWLRPRVELSSLRGTFRGDISAVLRALAALSTWPLADAIEVDAAEATYHHPALGTLAMSGLRVLPRGRAGSGVLLTADQVRLGKQHWRSVSLAVERRKDAFVIGWGEAVADSRIQLSCFPSSEGKARWLLEVLHQAARPLLARLGGRLGDLLQSAKIAGSLSLDVPDQADQPVSGRVQLVIDDWSPRPFGTAIPVVGSTLALVSNLQPAANGAGWTLPKVELRTPVFDLSGRGQVDLSEGPRLDMEATGERTCQQLGALLPPSPERDRVEAFLASREGKAAVLKTAKVRLQLRWRESEPAAWRFDGGCGLDPATL